MPGRPRSAYVERQAQRAACRSTMTAEYNPRMGAGPGAGFWQRILEFFGLRKPPPDSGVREPRRPTPVGSGGGSTLERPEHDDRFH